MSIFLKFIDFFLCFLEKYKNNKNIFFLYIICLFIFYKYLLEFLCAIFLKKEVLYFLKKEFQFKNLIKVLLKKRIFFINNGI